MYQTSQLDLIIPYKINGKQVYAYHAFSQNWNGEWLIMYYDHIGSAVCKETIFKTYPQRYYPSIEKYKREREGVIWLEGEEPRGTDE